jgi:hypothetical protein
LRAESLRRDCRRMRVIDAAPRPHRLSQPPESFGSAHHPTSGGRPWVRDEPIRRPSCGAPLIRTSSAFSLSQSSRKEGQSPRRRRPLTNPA